MPAWIRHQLILLIATGAVLFFKLGDARLWDRDEPRNAQCAVEMQTRGDWVVPYFNQELRTHKPVLLYWLIMSAYSIFGVSEFAARFWSAMLGVGTVLCTYHMGTRLFGRGAGFWGALSLAPALMFNVASRAATPDAALIFFVTATLTAYVVLAFRDGDAPAFPASFRSGAIIYALVALGVLAKGPIGLVMPVAIMSISLWLSRDGFSLGGSWQRINISFSPKTLWQIAWELRPFTALLMVSLIALPWYALVGWRTDGEFLVGFFWDHNVRRATESMENHRGSPIFYYPITILLGFFPASLFLLPSLLESWQRRSEATRAGAIFCVTWIAVFVGLFSLAGTKLPSYITPCYPALAMLVGRFIDGWTRSELKISAQWMRAAMHFLGAIGLLVSGAIHVLALKQMPSEQWLAFLGCVLVLGAIVALVLDARWQRRFASAGTLFASMLVFSMLLFGLGGAAADQHQQSHLIVEAIRKDCDSPEVAAWGGYEPSWVFYLKSPILELQESADAVRFANQLTPGKFMLVRETDYARLQTKLSCQPTVISRVPLFLKRDQVLVLGPPSVSTAQRAGNSEASR